MSAERPADSLNALTEPAVLLDGASGGPLSGTRFAVKDLYDVAGVTTGAGSPDWARTHEAAERTASPVQTLIDAGATLVGKTHTDELAWSILGENAHYGTPINPRAPTRVPGGSSSGSVVAVAGGLVDFALGSDTGGSVRIPASNCGVYGIRTTHGRIPLDHVVPLAPTYDTVGWFARDADTFARVGRAYFGEARGRISRLVVATDAFDLADAPVRAALEPFVERARSLVSSSSEEQLAPGGLGTWFEAWKVLQAREVWAAHGAWVQEARPSFGPGIADRFALAATLTAEDERPALEVRAEARARMRALCPEGTAVCLPAAPLVAPLLATPAAELEEYRARTMSLTCPAGHAGLPQISVPATEVDGAPIGLSFVAASGCDLELLDLAIAYEAAA